MSLYSYNNINYLYVIPDSGNIGTAVVTASSEATGDISILESFSVDSYTFNVISIDNSSFSGCYYLTSVVIPNSVTNIGYYAFSDCVSLTSIIIPNSVTNIDYYAFYNCINMTAITIPNSIINCGDYAFASCSNLNNIIINCYLYNFNNVFSDLNNNYGISLTFDYVGGIPDNACENITSITSVNILSNITSIGNYSFSGCTGLTNITISDSITSIGNYSFSGCTGLTNITIPSTVTSCGDYSFVDCSSLTNITINSYLLNLENIFYNVNNSNMNWTFNYIGNIPKNSCYQKYGLSQVTITELITGIEEYAFYGCSSLANISIPNSVISIDNYCFSGCSNLTSVTLAENITNIGSYAFDRCPNLQSIIIPNSVTSIGSFIFNNCVNLGSVTISNNITNIPEYAFSECSSLNNVIIPDSVTSINNYAFKYCFSLSNISLSNNINTLGDFVFLKCYNLSNITIPNTIIGIGSNIFDECSPQLNVNYNPTINDLPLDVTWYNFTLTMNNNDATTTTLLDSYMAIIDRTSFIKLMYNKENNIFTTNILATYANKDNGNNHNWDNENNIFGSGGTNITSIPELDNIYNATKWSLAGNNISYKDVSGNWTPISNNISVSYSFINISEPACFNEGTKILCLDKNFQDAYLPIETLRKGDFVKTYKHGYRRIETIGKQTLFNNPNKFGQCMYKMVKTEENGLIEDLIITGWHAILVDDLGEQKNENYKIYGSTKMIDKKYLLLSSVSKEFKKIETTEPFTYYHFVLESDDDETHFGVWANGILTESQNKVDFKQKNYILI